MIDALKELFKHNAKTIKVYFAQEVLVDPYEDEKELKYLQPVGIKALVSDLTFAQAQYKLPGINAEKSKEIIVHKKYHSLIERSYKIEIDGEFYYSWKVNGKCQIRQEGDYIRLYVYNNG